MELVTDGLTHILSTLCGFVNVFVHMLETFLSFQLQNGGPGDQLIG